MSTHLRLCFGLKLLLDRRGLISSSFILFIWLYGHLIVFLPILLPQYKDGNVSAIPVAAYVILSLCTFIAFFRSMFSDPGKVSNVKKEEIDWRTWEKCVRCCMARPPRSHHCSRCGHCVLQMDHHCQWINNCVGAKNFWIFYMLLVYAFTFVVTNISIYHIHKWGWLGECISCSKITWIDPLAHPVKGFSYFIAMLAFTGITLLMIMTGIHISLDMTTIETLEDPSIMYSRAREHGRILPTRSAVSKLCGTSNFLLWILPCRIRRDISQAGSQQYTV